MISRSKRKWVNKAVAYQIYPRSFYDSNADGIGDLRGIINKLDYLAGGSDSLGVNVIWLCPFYKSPMADFGYDIADYYSVDPVFGDMDDVRELISQAHRRGIRIFIDLVVNHTSNEHPWFIDSMSSSNSSKRQWYIWRDGYGQNPPNDWLSVFGGSAWQYDENTRQYYLHSFSAKQPDLNWTNPEVRQAVKDIMRFWLDLGVDGFRADAVYWLAKDHRYRNDPLKNHAPLPGQHQYDELQHTYSRNGHQLYEYLREMAAVLSEYNDKFMVVEAYPEAGKRAEEYLKFYQYVDAKHLAPFNFEGIYFAWDAAVFKSFIDQFQRGLKRGYLPVYTLGNHDQSRLASRIGEAAAPSAAVLQLTLPGMPFIYYGEEIGMKDVPIPSSLRKDPLSLHGYDRDKSRTPMQWDSSAHAGFSKNKPWLPVSKNLEKLSVKYQLAQPDSMLNLYRSLIEIRSTNQCLTYGNYKPLQTDDKSVLGFQRQYRRKKLYILVNFSEEEILLKRRFIRGNILLSTHSRQSHKISKNSLNLQPNEAVIIKP